MTCDDVHPLLAPFVDDEVTSAPRADLERHLAACAGCRARAEAEQAARVAVRARAAALRPRAPEGLRATCAALAARESGPRSRVARRSLWVPASIAAGLALVVVSGIANRSATLLAAQLTLDHIKCVDLFGPSHASGDARAVANTFARDYGWRLDGLAPPTVETQLVGARRCVFGDGRMAHVFYRHRGRPVSLYVMRAGTGVNRAVHVFGHDAVIWSSEGHTFALVGGASPDELHALAGGMKTRCKLQVIE